MQGYAPACKSSIRTQGTVYVTQYEGGPREERSALDSSAPGPYGICSRLTHREIAPLCADLEEPESPRLIQSSLLELRVIESSETLGNTEVSLCLSLRSRM